MHFCFDRLILAFLHADALRARYESGDTVSMQYSFRGAAIIWLNFGIAKSSRSCELEPNLNLEKTTISEKEKHTDIHNLSPVSTTCWTLASRLQRSASVWQRTVSVAKNAFHPLFVFGAISRRCIFRSNLPICLILYMRRNVLVQCSSHSVHNDETTHFWSLSRLHTIPKQTWSHHVLLAVSTFVLF